MKTCHDGIWPGGAQGAVSLTFDDGLPSQRERAIPLLEDRGLLGTFYLCPRGDNAVQALTPWREISGRGHEIGNHSLSHTCSRNFSDEVGASGLETMSLEDIERDILEAERRLNEAIPGSGPRSFCYPCYQTFVGEGKTRQSYVPVVARHFVAGRTIGEYGFFNHPLNCDLHAVWSTPGDHLRSSEMIGLVERAARQGRWLVFAFHEIGDGRLGVMRFDFTDLLDHLAEAKERVWTAPLRDVARRIRAR